MRLAARSRMQASSSAVILGPKNTLVVTLCSKLTTLASVACSLAVDDKEAIHPSMGKRAAFPFGRGRQGR